MRSVEVQVLRGEYDWLVWFDGRVVARFTLMGDALDYASLLECSPRARAAAASAA